VLKGTMLAIRVSGLRVGSATTGVSSMFSARSSRAGVFVAAALALLLLTAAVPPSQARVVARAQPVTKTVTMHQGFVGRGTVRFYNPNICVRWKYGGVINYRAMYQKYWGELVPEWLYRYTVDQVTVSDTTITLNGFAPNGSKCTTKARNWNQLNLEQHARGYSCSFNPSVSVSVPWALSVSGWPHCGSKQMKTVEYVFNAREHHHASTRAGQLFGFGGQAKQGFESPQTGIKWNCYGTNFKMIVAITNQGDENQDSGRVAACPGWDGSLGIF